MTKEEAFKEWLETSGPWHSWISTEDQKAIFMAGWEACLDAIRGQTVTLAGTDHRHHVGLCAHGRDPNTCQVCEDIRSGYVNTEG